MLETPTRPRGAQPGNQNARIHGFYTCNLDDLQESTIEQAKKFSGIDDEIAIVRTKLRNVLEKDPDNARLTAQLATTIGHLLRVRLKLGEAVKPGFQEGIDNIIREVGGSPVLPPAVPVSPAEESVVPPVSENSVAPSGSISNAPSSAVLLLNAPAVVFDPGGPFVLPGRSDVLAGQPAAAVSAAPAKRLLPVLYPFQREVLNSIMDSVVNRRGLTFSVEIARQGGKNEISAQLEMLLLARNHTRPGHLIKCSPTFQPQTLISMQRLKERLNDAGLNGCWFTELGYIVKLNQARAIFLSADKSANVVGNTAHLLLEVDESQDVDKQKYTKEFKPMGATSNCTVVHYGTTWNDSTLLEEVKQSNLELERKDGIKRHFRYDWQHVAGYNPAYLAYVEAERKRLGDNHPLFMTQYRLLPVHAGGGFLNEQQIGLLAGRHCRKRQPEHGKFYVAGIDLAGEAEVGDDSDLSGSSPKRDATVITIGELDYSNCDCNNKEPRILIVEHYAWTGRRHAELFPVFINILRDVWHCRKIAVDATGIGEPVSSYLQQVLHSKIIPFKFTAPSKSSLGFNLLAAVNAGRLKLYAGDGSPEYQEICFQIKKSNTSFRAGCTMNFFVDPADGHDDYLMSLALLVEAGNKQQQRIAYGYPRFATDL